jgi:zinc protease
MKQESSVRRRVPEWGNRLLMRARVHLFILRSSFLIVFLASSAWGQVADWPSQRPPRPLPATESTFPPYEVRTLKNGLQVVAVLHHEQPAVSIRLLVRAGGALDSTDKPGTAALAAALLDQGTTSRTAQELATAVDSVGGALGVGAGTDLTFVNAVFMKDSFDLGLRIVADVARNPAFRAEEIERQRQQMLSGLKVSYEDPDYIADVVFDRLVYGFHPYGKPDGGTPASIPRITRDDLVAFHRAYFAPNNAILAIVGDVTAEEAFAGAERAFGDWQRVEGIKIDPPSEPPPPVRRVIVVDRPGAVQTEIRVGHLAVPRRHRDYMAFDLAARILGGEGSNRLHRVLRSERGLTYGAAADLESLKYAGDLVAETDTRSDATGQALRLIVDEFWRLQREPVMEGELKGAQDYLAGSFPLTIETPSAIALQVLNALFFGLDLDELQTFRERVNRVTPDDIQRVARQYLKPDRLSIVLVGDASSFASELESAGFRNFERIPIGELDLSSADFRRRASPAGPAGSAGGSGAQASADPTALIDRAIEAKGGLERLRSVRTIRAVSDMELGPPDSAPVKVTTFIAYPDRFRVDLESARGTLTQVYAAGEAWVRQPGRPGAVNIAPEELKAAVARDVLQLLVAAKSGGVRLRGAANVTLDGRAVHAVDCGGDPAVRLLLDPVSGLVLAERYSARGPSGGEEIEERYESYRAVDGIQVPFATEVRRSGRTIIRRRLRDISFNETFPEGTFSQPS